MRTYLLALLGALLLLLHLNCDSLSRSCTAVGCESGARMNVDVPASSTPVDKMLITVCRNELCASGTPTVTRDPCAEGVIGCPTRVDCVLRGDVKVDCIVSGGSAADADASAPTFVSLDFLALTRADRDVLADGDKYTIRVTSPGAPAPLLDVSRTAVYAKSYPNGVGCDGEDGYCRSATLK